MNVLAEIIRLIHILIILFVMIGIFFTDKELISIHISLIASILVHWILNDDTCFLTILEKQLCGKEEDNDTFIYKIVSPIYKINDDKLRKLVHLVTFAIYSYSIYKYSKIKE